ncbi:MAG TPA: TlpA disulfide reductase family protein, partial [Parapedobacter sp.]|nr:TlpA disulfide reductase family protein [Parapedobacter sp.]
QEVLEVGQPAPEISLPTPTGESVALSSLKGKLVLVDFWATWCAPCVKEQPELKALYEKYNGGATAGQFEIFGVSLDKSRDNWIKSIDRLDINWIQVSDLMFWKSPVAKDYAIQELPFNVLVGEQGDIVAINLHGEELEDFIAAHFDNN